MSSDAASLVRVAKRDFEKAIKVPPDYVARASAAGSASYDAWTRARPADDFATMAPYLERTIALSREYAGFFAPYAHIADPLIDGADEGMTVASVRTLFAALRRELVPIVHAIAAQPAADETALRGSFDEPAQIAFGRSVVERIGYDFDRGRLDKTHHPFATRFSTGDVRITTRVDPSDIGQALFSTIHEAGHALYEQGVAAGLDGTPARQRGVGGRAREPVAAVGKRGRPRSRILGAFLPGAAGNLPGPVPRRDAGDVLSRHQQGRAVPDPHRCRRGDLQSPYHDALRSRGGFAGRPVAGRGPAGGVARPHGGRSRHRAVRRSRRLPAGRALVWRQPRRRIPGLYHRQYSQRPVPCRRGEGPPGNPARDRGRPVRNPARLAHRQALPPRPQIHAGRTGDAGHRRAHEHCALSRLSARQVWRILPPAGAAADAEPSG